jgi:hypothetical protein
MHSTELLEQFRTGEKGIVHCQLINTKGRDSKPVEFDREGDKYKAGLGDAFVRLHELLEEKKKRSTWWYRFWNGRFSCLELDISIKRLLEQLNYTHIEWTE